MAVDFALGVVKGGLLIIRIFTFEAPFELSFRAEPRARVALAVKIMLFVLHVSLHCR